MREQEDILQLARSLTTTGEQLRQEIQATVGVATKMDELDVSGPEREVLLIPLKIWMNMHSLASQYLEELVDLLPQLSDAGAKTRFHIALARLHTTMWEPSPPSSSTGSLTRKNPHPPFTSCAPRCVRHSTKWTTKR